MKHRRYWVGGFVLLVLAGAVWAAVGTAGAGTARHAKTDRITLQLKWVTQAQFAGYYAAKAKGYYKQQGLDVNLKVGGPTITPEQVVLGKQAEFGIDWVPSLLSFRDGGKKIMQIAQVFSRSGMTEISWKDSGITTIGKMRGKKVGVWCCGNENELYAASMTYNELAQVLETKNPKTGKLYTLSDLNVISMENASKGAGTSMLEDEIFV